MQLSLLFLKKKKKRWWENTCELLMICVEGDMQAGPACFEDLGHFWSLCLYRKNLQEKNQENHYFPGNLG